MQKTVFLMSPDQIDHYWLDIARTLGEVPGYYEFFTPEWTYSRAKSGDLQVWGMTDGRIQAIAITQILAFPAQKAFEILACGGAGMLDYLDEMDDVFEKIAEQAGCQTLITRTRPGIERLLMKKGVFRGCVWLYRPVGKRSSH